MTVVKKKGGNKKGTVTRVIADEEIRMNQAIGLNVKTLRAMSGKSQEELAKAIKVSSYQLLKYEAGKNGLSAYRLRLCANVLGVRMDAFFEDYEDSADLPRFGTRDRTLRMTQTTYNMVRDYEKLPDKIRAAYRALIRGTYEALTQERQAKRIKLSGSRTIPPGTDPAEKSD